MFDFNGKNVLVLAPHTDDAELGMGGTIAKVKRNGGNITVVAFSAAEQSLPEGFSSESTRNEFSDAMKVLGVDEYTVLSFETREFPRDRQKILEQLIKLRAKLCPDIVFLPASQDIHQDHNTIHVEGLRAFKNTSILGYEMPWNSYSLSSNVYIQLTASEVEKKFDSIMCYKSQLAKNSIYLDIELIASQMRVNSARLGVDGNAEAFELIRLVDL